MKPDIIKSNILKPMANRDNQLFLILEQELTIFWYLFKKMKLPERHLFLQINHSSVSDTNTQSYPKDDDNYKQNPFF